MLIKQNFDSLNWKTRLIETEQGPLSDYRIRFKSQLTSVSKAYEIKSVE